MTLIKSISGIRGIIGGKEDNGLTPFDILKYASSFAKLVCSEKNNKIVIGRDGRVSGLQVKNLVNSALYFIGIEVIDLDLSTTPTVEMAVVKHQAAGGIIITASHNPMEWNALKLLNDKGEFISSKLGQKLLDLSKDADKIEFSSIKNLGSITHDDSALDYHINEILKLKLVNTEAIKNKNFKIIVDAINSSGAFAVPQLLKKLGVAEENITVINSEINGVFAHNPEPLPEHLKEIQSLIENGKYDLGIVVDPDVDRLCFICEDGSMFGEEYTLVSIADYVLKNEKTKIAVSNLSSTKALQDVVERQGGKYFASAVGEVNVVELMKKENAVIGGEGNGGVIYPELHYGRDALVGIALFLSHLSLQLVRGAKNLKRSYPEYCISKNKINLSEGLNIETIFAGIAKKYKKMNISKIDGLKITFEEGEWVHLRPSNTEPIIRIYSESQSQTTADNIAKKLMADIHEFSKD